MDTIPAIVLVTLTASALLAAWPLILLPRFRPAVLGVGGSGCIGLGAAIIGLLAGGFVQLPGSGSQAAADDKPAEATAPQELAEAIKTDEPVIETTVVIPPGRPQWVGTEPNKRGKIHSIPVSSGPYAVDTQSRKALDEEIVKATDNYIAEQLESEMAPKLLHIRWPNDYSPRTIRQRFVKQDNVYHDVARYSVGWMHENFALLEFGPDFRNELDKRWTQVRATSRVAQTGLISGGVLLLLSSVFGYFRLDNATRGYYTGRLQFMTAAAILAVVAGGAALARWIPWL